MPLPEFRADGWLPEGHHAVGWEEIAARFGGTPGSHRATIFFRLLKWRDAVRNKGMGGRLILNGSFISEKDTPGDFDCIFVYNEDSSQIISHDAGALALLDNTYCKGNFGGDVLCFAEASIRDFPQFCRTDSFDRSKVTLQPKGVVEVEI